MPIYEPLWPLERVHACTALTPLPHPTPPAAGIFERLQRYDSLLKLPEMLLSLTRQGFRIGHMGQPWALPWPPPDHRLVYDQPIPGLPEATEAAVRFDLQAVRYKKVGRAAQGVLRACAGGMGRGNPSSGWAWAGLQHTAGLVDHHGKWIMRTAGWQHVPCTPFLLLAPAKCTSVAGWRSWLRGAPPYVSASLVALHSAPVLACHFHALQEALSGAECPKPPPELNRFHVWRHCKDWAWGVHPKGFRSSFGYNTNVRGHGLPCCSLLLRRTSPVSSSMQLLFGVLQRSDRRRAVLCGMSSLACALPMASRPWLAAWVGVLCKPPHLRLSTAWPWPSPPPPLLPPAAAHGPHMQLWASREAKLPLAGVAALFAPDQDMKVRRRAYLLVCAVATPAPARPRPAMPGGRRGLGVSAWVGQPAVSESWLTVLYRRLGSNPSLMHMLLAARLPRTSSTAARGAATMITCTVYDLHM